MHDGKASEQKSEAVLGQDERKPRSLEEPGGSLGGRRGGRGGKCRRKDKKTVVPPTDGDDAARDLSSLRAADFATKVPRHQFPLGVVAGSLALVLRTGTRLKRAASVLALNWSWWADGGAAGTYYSVRLWLLRLGLHQLNRPRELADDWMWIIDHTMQLGERKCLIIVGLRQSAWDAKDRCLSHEDVQLIDLQPVTTSTGEVVYQQLEAATAKTGVPRAIISDDGRDLHKGINQFLTAHAATVWLYDIKHKTACLLKHELESDSSWQAFVEAVNRFKQRVSVTALACLLPPQQRGKARYLNIDVLVDWAEKKLALLDRPDVLAESGLNAATVEEKLGWLREFATQVRRWREALAVIEIAEHYVRHEGIHPRAAEELSAALPQATSEPARRFRETLLQFIQQEARQAREKECLLGSSEVLESIIGKFKCVAGERGQHGLTGMVLSLGALVGQVTLGTVQAALAEVTNKKVWDWCHSHLGSTVQGVRRQITLALDTEQKRKPLLLGKT
jgi:hypothetical protein